MTSRSRGQSKYEQFLILLTQFYCNLTTKKDIHSISEQIRQFIMSNSNIKNKDQQAKKILDFFLNVQSKLKSKTDKEWDTMFQLQTARAYALLKMCQFPTKNLLLCAFRHLRYLQKQQMTVLMDNIPHSAKTLDLQSQNDNIQIQKDIRIKTNCFQRWCQFVQKSKIFKQLKKRDAQNQRISLSFNKYGLKFNYFHIWKKVYKKNKSQLQKLRIIEQKYKQNLLLRHLFSIQQVSAIISFESQLTKKIKKILIECRKKKLYRRLKDNIQKIKIHTKYKKIQNKQVYFFIEHFSKRLKPLMNKSYKLARIKLEKDFQKSILLSYFHQLLKFYQERRKKLSQIVKRRKIFHLCSWKNLFQSQISLIQKQNYVTKYLPFQRKKNVLAVLKFDKLISQNQFNKLQGMKESLLTNRSFLEANIKKQIEQKKKIFIKFLHHKGIEKFLKNLTKSIQTSIKIYETDNSTLRVYLNRVIKRYKSYKMKKQYKNKFYLSLQEKHGNNAMMTCFKKWRRLKHYHKIQQSSLNGLANCCRKIAMTRFWSKFVFRVKQKQCIARLTNISNLIVLKIAYFKLFKRSNIINSKIQIKRQLANIKIMKKLFNLLTENSKFNTERAKEIKTVSSKRWQNTLIKRLIQANQLKNHTIKTQKIFQIFNKKLFIKKLCRNQNQTKNQKKNIQLLSKKVFIRYLKKSFISGVQIQKKIELKIQELKLRHRQNISLQFFEQLKYNITSKQLITDRKNLILAKVFEGSIQKFKCFSKFVKNKKKIQMSQNLLIIKKQSQAIKLLNIKNKYKKLTTFLQKIRKNKNIKDFKSICSSQININKSYNSFREKLLTKYKKQFYKYLLIDKKQFDHKIKIFEDHQKVILTQKMKQFVSILKTNKQNVLNSQKLEKIKKTRLFSQFIATHLKYKFYKIKFNCSLKSYAKSLLRKALIGLKQNKTQLRQKQNLIRMDRTSSIVIQRSIQKSFKSNSLSQQISKFNLRKSRQIRG